MAKNHKRPEEGVVPSYSNSPAIVTNKASLVAKPVSQEIKDRWEEYRKQGYAIAEEYEIAEERKGLAPFYSDEELVGGIVVKILGEGEDSTQMNNGLPSKYFDVLDIETGLQRVLYQTYNIQRAIEWPRDQNQVFHIVYSDKARTKQQHDVKIYEIQRLVKRAK